MKGRRGLPRKRKRVDPVQQFMDDALRSGEYNPFYCGTHGKFLFLPGTRGTCPVCDQPCFTPEEWQYRQEQSSREARVRRVQMLRNHLE